MPHEVDSFFSQQTAEILPDVTTLVQSTCYCRRFSTFFCRILNRQSYRHRTELRWTNTNGWR